MVAVPGRHGAALVDDFTISELVAAERNQPQECHNCSSKGIEHGGELNPNLMWFVNEVQYTETECYE